MSLVIVSRDRAQRVVEAFQRAGNIPDKTSDAFWQAYKVSVNDLGMLMRVQGLVQGLAIADIRANKESDNESKNGRMKALEDIAAAMKNYRSIAGGTGPSSFRELWEGYRTTAMTTNQMLAEKKELAAIITWLKIWVETKL